MCVYKYAGAGHVLHSCLDTKCWRKIYMFPVCTFISCFLMPQFLSTQALHSLLCQQAQSVQAIIQKMRKLLLQACIKYLGDCSWQFSSKAHVNSFTTLKQVLSFASITLQIHPPTHTSKLSSYEYPHIPTSDGAKGIKCVCKENLGIIHIVYAKGSDINLATVEWLVSLHSRSACPHYCRSLNLAKQSLLQLWLRRSGQLFLGSYKQIN